MANSQRKNSAPRSYSSVQREPHDRMARRLKRRRRRRPASASNAVVGAQVDEEAVVAVDLRRAQRLAVHGQDALALFAGALGEQLLQPGAEGGDRRRGDERQLVALLVGQRAQDRRRARRRDSRARRHSARTPAPSLGAVEQRAEVDADERRRHQAEVRERRVAAADVRRVAEDRAEVRVVRQLLERRAGVGDGDEAACPASSPDPVA